jgi:hypothetical protein
VPEKKKRYRALVGMNLGKYRVEAGELIPTEAEKLIPEVWIGTKVEEA